MTLKLTFMQRFARTMALAALPTVGACGGAKSGPGDMGGGFVSMVGDLSCPTLNNECYWFAYVDAGPPSSKVTIWPGDGGNPCPCDFTSHPAAVCGSCQVVPTPCGPATICSLLECEPMCDASGRRPAGLQFVVEPEGPELAAWLARVTRLEAASVPAFAQLVRELELHGAPEVLIAAARRARADEVRHARVMGDFAFAAGATRLPVEVAPMPLRPLLAIALENAVEGCVRETAGALQAERQARAVTEPRLADALRAIAADERRHAALAWAVDDWAQAQLTDEERRLVENAKLEAARELQTGELRLFG